MNHLAFTHYLLLSLSNLAFQSESTAPPLSRPGYQKVTRLNDALLLQFMKRRLALLSSLKPLMLSVKKSNSPEESFKTTEEYCHHHTPAQFTDEAKESNDDFNCQFRADSGKNSGVNDYCCHNHSRSARANFIGIAPRADRPTRLECRRASVASIVIGATQLC